MKNSSIYSCSSYNKIRKSFQCRKNFKTSKCQNKFHKKQKRFIKNVCCVNIFVFSLFLLIFTIILESTGNFIMTSQKYQLNWIFYQKTPSKLKIVEFVYCFKRRWQTHYTNTNKNTRNFKFNILFTILLRIKNILLISNLTNNYQ